MLFLATSHQIMVVVMAEHVSIDTAMTIANYDGMTLLLGSIGGLLALSFPLKHLGAPAD